MPPPVMFTLKVVVGLGQLELLSVYDRVSNGSNANSTKQNRIT